MGVFNSTFKNAALTDISHVYPSDSQYNASSNGIDIVDELVTGDNNSVYLTPGT